MILVSHAFQYGNLDIHRPGSQRAEGLTKIFIKVQDILNITIRRSPSGTLGFHLHTSLTMAEIYGSWALSANVGSRLGIDESELLK